MSVAAQRTLRSAILERRFEPVYYLHGDDDYRKDDAIGQVVAAAVDAAMRDFNLETFRGSEVDADQLAASLSSLPMFGDRRVVVLRDVGALKKRPRAVLDAYLAAPSPATVLLLTSPSGAKPDAVIGSRAVDVPFPALGAEKVTTWLEQRARALGAELPHETAARLAGVVDGDLAFGAGEIDKLVSYAGARPITVADIEAVVGLSEGADVTDLLDAVAARDGARAAALVAPVLAQPRASAVPIVSALVTQTLAMAWGRAGRDTGLAASRLESEYYKLIKSGVSPGRPWADAVKCWSSHLGKWTSADLGTALDRLLAADLALKDSRVSSEEGVLTSLVLALCASSGKRAA